MGWVIAGCGLMGSAVAMFAYAGDTSYERALAWMEAEFRDKLRKLRISSRHLRRWLIAWSILVLSCFLTFWLIVDSLVFGVLFAGLLLTGPWYILRRMAEHRHEKIEDQLAD